MENLIVALTNAPALFPLYKLYSKGDYLSTGILSGLTLASFGSHLVENHKHNMKGVFPSLPLKISYWACKTDVLFSGLTAIRMAYLYYKKFGFSLRIILRHPSLLLFAPVVALLGYVSEFDQYNPDLKRFYMLSHSLWHIGIFTLLNEFVRIVK